MLWPLPMCRPCLAETARSRFKARRAGLPSWTCAAAGGYNPSMLYLFRTLAMVLLLILASGTNPCLAQEDDPVAARVHFSRGTRLYEVGEYKQALEEFKAAHLAKPDPAFLYNIAQCHRQMGDLEQTSIMYGRYLAANPGAKNRAEVEARIAEIEEALAAAKQKSTAEAANAPPGSPLPPPPSEAQAAPTVPVSAIEVPAEPKRGLAIGDLRFLRWVGVGVTAALAASAITTGVLAQTKYNDLKDGCGRTSEGCSSGDIDGVKTRALVTNVLWGLAGAAAIGTGVMFYLTPRQASAQLAWSF